MSGSFVLDKHDLYDAQGIKLASCESEIHALILLKAMNKPSIPDPYSGPPDMTDCEIWSEDLIEVLSLQFRNENLDNNDATPSQMRDAKKKLHSALVWFYQTHL